MPRPPLEQRKAPWRAFPSLVKGTILQLPPGRLRRPVRRLEVLMFESLDEQMKHDEDRVSTSSGRMLRYGLYAVAGLVVIGGLIYAVHLIG